MRQKIRFHYPNRRAFRLGALKQNLMSSKSSSHHSSGRSKFSSKNGERHGSSNSSDISRSDDFDSESDVATSPVDTVQGGDKNKTFTHNFTPRSSRILSPVSMAYMPRPKRTVRQNGLVKHAPKDSSLLEKASTQRRFKVNELHNDIQVLQQKLKELSSENKLLKRTQRRQSIALKRYEGHEGELPTLIRSHEEEVRALKEQLRKVNEKYRVTDRRLRDKSSELERTRMQLQRLQALVREQNLEERTTLSKKVETLQLEILLKENKVKDLQHHVELTDKNYKHQLSIEFARHKETKKQVSELQCRIERLTNQLKDKERELDVRNIYSIRGKSPKNLLAPPSASPPRQQLPSKSETEFRPRFGKETLTENIAALNERVSKAAAQRRKVLPTDSSLEQQREYRPGLTSTSDKSEATRFDSGTSTLKSNTAMQSRFSSQDSSVDYDELNDTYTIGRHGIHSAYDADLLHDTSRLPDDLKSELQRETSISQASSISDLHTAAHRAGPILPSISANDAPLQGGLPAVSGHKHQQAPKHVQQQLEPIHGLVQQTNSVSFGRRISRAGLEGGDGKPSTQIHMPAIDQAAVLRSSSPLTASNNDSELKPVTNKTRKTNLMRQLFGSLDSNRNPDDDDGFIGHVLKPNVPASHGSRNGSATTVRQEHAKDDLIDIFNNNIKANSNSVQPRRSRQRNSIDNSLSGGSDEHANSVLF